MQEQLIRDLYEQEDTVWWHVSKRRQILDLALRHFPPTEGSRALEIGCGAGRTLQDLGKLYGEAWGADLSRTSLSSCRERGLARLVMANAERGLPFVDGAFRLAVCSDILEHLAEDEAAMRELFRTLEPGGGLVASSPAHPSLFSYWDEIHGHKRRYTRDELGDKLRRAGFDVLKLSYTNAAIYPAAAAVRKVKGALLRGKPQEPKSDFGLLPPFLNSALLGVYNVERAAIRKMNMPFGLSLAAVAKKP